MIFQRMHDFDIGASQSLPQAPGRRIAAAPGQCAHRRRMGIRAALEWAFGVEHARLDLDDEDSRAEGRAVSPLWTVMRRGQLGCRIDGGGRSAPARDADLIADLLARLPSAIEGRPMGRAMALRIAELARAGAEPDWGRNLRPRCIPVGWRCENQFGPQALTEVVGHERLWRRGRVVVVPVLACPVTYTANPRRISAARRQYLDWVTALAWLAQRLRTDRVLERIEITADLPDPEPWRACGAVSAALRGKNI